MAAARRSHHHDHHRHRHRPGEPADDHPTHRHDTHEHPHQHEHRRAPPRWLRERLAPHTHDTAGKLDTALETNRAGIRCVTVSFLGLLVTAVLQAAVVLASGSVALLGDTLHNAADALTAVPLAIAFTLGRRPANHRYTYGYGRAEDLAGLVVVLLITASAAAAGYQAVDRLLQPRHVQALWLVAAAGVVGFAGNELVARYRIVVGRRIGSAALVAEGLHARTDGLTSLAVVLGAAGVALGWPPADPVVGMLITVAILAVLRDAAREIYRRLMDAVDPDLVDQADATLRSTPGVRDIGDLRLRWIGHALRAEVEVVLDPHLPLLDAHHIAHDAEHRLLHTIPRLSAALVHADPGTRAATAHEQVAHHR
jgi:cation diffusion facilitator family transporter